MHISPRLPCLSLRTPPYSFAPPSRTTIPTGARTPSHIPSIALAAAYVTACVAADVAPRIHACAAHAPSTHRISRLDHPSSVRTPLTKRFPLLPATLSRSVPIQANVRGSLNSSRQPQNGTIVPPAEVAQEALRSSFTPPVDVQSARLPSASALLHVYGFEEIVIPALPAGAHLNISQIKEPSREATSTSFISLDMSEEERMLWKHIRAYVAASIAKLDSHLVGAEVWPAAAFLCDWMLEMEHAIRGASVLEIGAGTGVCGLFASGVGASHVVLSDGGPAELAALIERNIADNAIAVSNGRVTFQHLPWGDTSNELLDSARLGWDWVLASDVTYAHNAHTSLAATLHALLISGGAQKPRIVLAHEHRDRDRQPHDRLQHWEEGDPVIEEFKHALAAVGLVVVPLKTIRPRCVMRGAFASWSADVTIFEVIPAKITLDQTY